MLAAVYVQDDVQGAMHWAILDIVGPTTHLGMVSLHFLNSLHWKVRLWQFGGRVKMVKMPFGLKIIYPTITHSSSMAAT